MKRFFSITTTLLTAVVGLCALFVLASSLPIDGNYEILIVESGSMEPAIRTGSVVAYIPRDSYHEGDVVTFKGTDINPMPTTHRIVAVEDGRITTKGDANEEPDYRILSEEEILGKVFLTVPYAGYISAYFRTPDGKAVLVVVGIVLSLLIFIPWRKLLVDTKKDAEET